MQNGNLEINPGTFSEFQFLFPSELKNLLIDLHRVFEPERQELLAARRNRQISYNNGGLPTYHDQNSTAASGSWRIAPLPSDLLKRRVEITGPVHSKKMVINMLSRNADGMRANTAMLDFEDSMKPTWPNVLSGFSNLIGAVKGTLTYDDTETRKSYRLDPSDMPLIMTRVRGLHLYESNVTVDGAPVAAGLFDFAVSFYHTARLLTEQGKTPKFYIPKTEHYLEARWWNNLFCAMESSLGIPTGTMKATFLIETLPAAFQMEEILYEIRDHAAGLNVGRWDKIFSDIKILRNHTDRVLADRGWIHLERPWMLNYAKRLIKICHRRGAMAIGGMAAFTPGKTPERRAEQTAKVAEDKQFEASIGHDGCWVSHPYFISTAMQAFAKDNQLDQTLDSFDPYPDLLPTNEGPKTLAGLRKNIRVGIAYMHGWNTGLGCVAWDDLMEDLATLEISRTQTWQWLSHQIQLDDGVNVTPELVGQIFTEELKKIIDEIEPHNPNSQKLIAEFEQAGKDAADIFTESKFREFLTTFSEIE